MIKAENLIMYRAVCDLCNWWSRWYFSAEALNYLLPKENWTFKDLHTFCPTCSKHTTEIQERLQWLNEYYQRQINERNQS